MHFSYLRIFLLAATSLLLASCITGEKSAINKPFTVSYPEGTVPEFWLEYYPYPPRQSPSIQPAVRAIPPHEGWTDMRMERDLIRISEAGFSTILLYVTPQVLATAEFQERLVAFDRIIRQLSAPPSIALAVYSPTKAFTLSLPNMMNFVAGKALLNRTNPLLIQGKPVLFFHESIRLTGEYEGSLRCVSLKEFFPPVEEFKSGEESAGCRVGTAVFSTENTVKAYRENGAIFVSQLQQAFHCKAKIILISSWNNYEDLSFIERNSFDENKMLEILQRARKGLIGADQ